MLQKIAILGYQEPSNAELTSFGYIPINAYSFVYVSAFPILFRRHPHVH